VRSADEAAAAVAASQHGVVSTAQLLECGLTRTQLKHRVASGHLQRLWRGVYAWGHRELRPEGHLIAAVLASGEGALVGFRSAIAHWELLPIAPAAIDIVVPGRGTRTGRTGIRLHRARRLDAVDVTKHRRVPITSVARSLVDFCATGSGREIERAYEQAVIRRLVTLDAVVDALERAPGRRTKALRSLVATERRTTTVTRSELEERFLALMRHAGLPEPEINARLAGYEVDFLWREQRRIIEVDGYAYHSTRQATTRDRRKDDDLEAAGYRVTRFTADQILRDPEDTLARATRAVRRAQ
jgi:very-short-patch-repair endonuclease/predicted transcriptional regulator of viral defense system